MNLEKRKKLEQARDSIRRYTDTSAYDIIRVLADPNYLKILKNKYRKEELEFPVHKKEFINYLKDLFNIYLYSLQASDSKLPYTVFRVMTKKEFEDLEGEILKSGKANLSYPFSTTKSFRSAVDYADSVGRDIIVKLELYGDIPGIDILKEELGAKYAEEEKEVLFTGPVFLSGLEFYDYIENDMKLFTVIVNPQTNKNQDISKQDLLSKYSKLFDNIDENGVMLYLTKIKNYLEGNDNEDLLSDKEVQEWMTNVQSFVFSMYEYIKENEIGEFNPRRKEKGEEIG